jgi:hypothetical protein
VSNSCRCPPTWARPSLRISATKTAQEQRPPFIFAVNGALPRTEARCQRRGCTLRAATRPGRRAAPRLTSVSARLDSAHTARGRLVARNWRGSAPSKPTEHLDLCSGGYQCIAFPCHAVGRQFRPVSSGQLTGNFCRSIVSRWEVPCRCVTQRRRTSFNRCGAGPTGHH